MAFIRLPLGIRVAMEYNLHGKIVVNVYHVTSDTPITVATLDEIILLFKLWWTDHLSACVSHDVSLVGISALNLDKENGEKVFETVSPPIDGGGAGDAVSNNVAMCVGIKTALTGRSYQGRSYIAGLQESDVTANEINAVRTSQAITAFGELFADLQLLGYNPVIASFISLGQPRVEAIATLWESLTVDSRVDTQRRRLPKA